MGLKFLPRNRVQSATKEELLQFTESDSGVRVIVKNTTGDPILGRNGTICINLYDSSVSIYADGGWRVLSTWYVPAETGSRFLKEDSGLLLLETGDVLLLE